MTGDTPTWGRYVELRPAELAAIRRQIPVVFLPWGALEWHGPHLPLGLDGIIAEAVAGRAVRRTGGVLLPTTWWPVGALPHAESLTVTGDTVSSMWDSLFAKLAKAGWQVAVLISGHGGQAQELALIAAAERAIARHGLLVLALPALAIVDESMLDHAAIWESSLLLALRPDLVRLDALGVGQLHLENSAVIGRDPRDTASASLGMSALNLAVERITSAVSELVASRNAAPLHALYEQRRERHQAFVERYGSDPEQATQAWWEELTRERADGVGPSSIET